MLNLRRKRATSLSLTSPTYYPLCPPSFWRRCSLRMRYSVSGTGQWNELMFRRGHIILETKLADVYGFSEPVESNPYGIKLDNRREDERMVSK